MKALVLFYALITSYLLAQFSRSILPERNFNDDSTIQDFIRGNEASVGPSPYSTTAWLFRILGLGDSAALVSFIAVSMTAVAVFVALHRLGPNRRSWPTIWLAAICLGLAGIYLGKYSKEFFVVPLVVLFIVLAGKRWLYVAWIPAALLYAVYVREYWYLVVALFLGFRLALGIRRGVAVFSAIWVAAMLALVIAFNVGLGVSANYFRAITNEGLNTDRSTVIADFIPTGAIPLEFVNLILVAVTLLIPVPLFLAGSPFHILSALVVGAVWVAVLRRAARYIRTRTADWSTPADEVLACCLSLLFAFLTTQSLFEPDYGSYVRHLAPLLPVAIFALAPLDRERTDK